MITDEQGREWLLKKLYNDGWRYIVGSNGTFIYLTKIKPLIINGAYKCNNEEYTCIGRTHGILPDLGAGEVMDIAEELGIIDWSNIEVDTPVFVRDSENEVWKCRYFAKYEYEKVYTWVDGRTSWSNKIIDVPVCWKYAKLAEV